MALETLGIESRDSAPFGWHTLAVACYPLYRRLFDEESAFVTSLDEKLTESRMTAPVEMYCSTALGVGAVLALTLWVFGTAIGYALVSAGLVGLGPWVGIGIEGEAVRSVLTTAKGGVVVLVSGVVFGGIGFGLGFGSRVARPYLVALTRGREIEMLLPDAISYMYALSVGGLNEVEILRAMAAADDTYGEVTLEFRSIVQETEYFDTDYRTAIRRQADRTPSDELSRFLTDMLSIVDSGGDMEQFLEDKKNTHLRTAKQRQTEILDTLELFGEMYLTLSLFPLLLIVVLVVMTMMGKAGSALLYVTVYGLIPGIGAAFLALVAIFKWDEPGTGTLTTDDDSVADGGGPPDLGPVESFRGRFDVFEHIRTQELLHAVADLLTHPHDFFRRWPVATLAVSVPVAGAAVVLAALSGVVPTSWDGLVAQPVWGTFVWFYLPVYLITIPFVAFRVWNLRARRSVLRDLTEALRKLSSANDSGMTLLDAIRLVGESSSGRLAREFEILYAKVRYGMSLSEALVSFNNDYRIPRLARTVRLVSKSQEASNHISEVLRTAARASENRDDIERERRSRTRIQVVVIVMTFVTLLGVMVVLKTQFLDTMAGLGEGSSARSRGFSFGAIDGGLLGLLFFHAVTIQAVASGLISGYIRESELAGGIKYAVALLTVALLVWTQVG